MYAETGVSIYDMNLDYKSETNGDQITKLPLHLQEYMFG